VRVCCRLLTIALHAATRAKGIRLLRTVMQRKGGKLAKLHRFAWSEARDADGPDEHQASGVALQQYVASHRSCPVVLGSLERHSNGLLGRIGNPVLTALEAKDLFPEHVAAGPA